MYSRHYILEGKKVKAVSFEEWVDWCVKQEKTKDKWTKVAYTEIGYNIEVSTVFIMGINHNFLGMIDDDSLSEEDKRIPILFETMVFASEFPEIDRFSLRYTTWQDAESGHDLVVNYVRNYIEKWVAANKPVG